MRTETDDPSSNETALAYLKVTVMDGDPAKVGRAAFGKVPIEMALATYPGFFGTSLPDEGSPYGVFIPVVVPRDLVTETVLLGGNHIAVTNRPSSFQDLGTIAASEASPNAFDVGEATTLSPLGLVCGARCRGRKGRRAGLPRLERAARQC